MLTGAGRGAAAANAKSKPPPMIAQNLVSSTSKKCNLWPPLDSTCAKHC